MSGSVSTFDITGTMWIVSLLFTLGLKSMWVHWMWGFMMAAFFFAYMGRWVRRSNVLTGAEWMVTRFGDGRPGQAARLAYAVLAVVTGVGFIGYGAAGIGKFADVFFGTALQEAEQSLVGIPILGLLTQVSTELQLAVLIIGATSLYVILGGVYSVIILDVMQTVMLLGGALILMWRGFAAFDAAAFTQQMPAGWFDLVPSWTLSGAEVDAAYHMFGLLVIIWVTKGLLNNAGGPQQLHDFQRFLAARTPDDAAKIGAAWSFFLTWRWGLCMAICVLAVSGGMSAATPDAAERLMPEVLKALPVGMCGLVLAGFIAAFMSTFDSTINAGASYLVRDMYNAYIHPEASQRELVVAGYVASGLLVVAGLAMRLAFGDRISTAFNWIMLSLGAGVLIPNVLRWYWWRFNGWGFAGGTVTGIVASFVQLLVDRFAFPDIEIPIYVSFPIIAGVGTVASVVISLLTEPTPSETLQTFYRTIQPGGWWRPVHKAVVKADPAYRRTESFGLAVVNTCVGMVAVFSMYMAPMELVLHRFRQMGVWLALLAVTLVVLYMTWYRPLRRPIEAGVSEDPSA